MTERATTNKEIKRQIRELIQMKNFQKERAKDVHLERSTHFLEKAIESMNNYVVYNSSREEILEPIFRR